MRVFLMMFYLFLSINRLQAQIRPVIHENDVERIENTLAADDMQGRKVYTPGIEKAASFIVQEFKEAGLQPFPGTKDFKQTFKISDQESLSTNVSFEGVQIKSENVIVHSASPSLVVTPADHYAKIIVRTNAEFSTVIHKYLESGENIIILVDTLLSKKFARLAAMHLPQFEQGGTRVYILTSANPKQFRIEIKQNIKSQMLSNIVGILPGKSKPGEYVIFSAHYDHLGVEKNNNPGDSIFNGANDNASGVTAVILLADYFRKSDNNQRTLIFVAFTAEEIGEIGSAYFAKTIDPEKVVAMFNIEMIGTESKWGKKSAFITGFEKSDFGTILQKNIAEDHFRFYPDPYPEQLLFLRSDNASLAKLGVPAHTISTSKMDSEIFYHRPEDEVKTLDLKNMTEIIAAIGMSAESLITGGDTPTRVKM